MGQFVPNFEYFWPPAMNETGWTIAFYGAGLDPIPANLKTVYTDQSEATPHSNPAEFDIDGKVSVVLGEGGYKIVVRNPLDEVASTKDNVSNSGGTPSGSESFYVENIADLRNFDRYTGVVEVGGYYTPGDGGGGNFYWDADSTTPDNGGYTISPASLPFAGRWIRIPDEDGMVRAASFGALGTSSVRTSELVNARTYAAAQGLVLYIHKPVKTATITFTPRWVEFGPDGYLYPSGATTVTFQGLVVAGAFRIFDVSAADTLTVVFNAYQVSRPEWFGASQIGSNNSAYFTKWLASGGGALDLPPGSWKSSTAFTPTLPLIAPGNVTSNISPYAESFPNGIRWPLGSLFEFGTWRTPGGNAYIDAFFSSFSVFGALAISDEVYADKSITVTENIFVGESATVDENVSAGGIISAGAYIEAAYHVSAGRYVKARAGTSAYFFKASGNLFTVIGSGDGTIGANALETNNDRVHIKGFGTRSAGSGNFTLTVNVGGQPIFSKTISSVDLTNYWFDIDLFRTGATSSFSVGAVVTNDAVSGNITTTADTRTASITWANANTVSVSASDSSSTVTKTLLIGDLYPT